jgi:putative intracellular protease/amidase
MSGIGNMKIAVLATEGLEQVELTEPLKALRAASADVAEIAPGQIRAGNHREKGKMPTVGHDLACVSASPRIADRDSARPLRENDQADRRRPDPESRLARPQPMPRRSMPRPSMPPRS